MTSFVAKIREFFRDTRAAQQQLIQVQKRQLEIAIEDYILKYRDGNNRYTEKSLKRFEAQVFSQNGEDGVIAEIFRRIGTTNKFFVEFGVGPGIENNTLNLLMSDWQGVWIEGDPARNAQINEMHKDRIEHGRLKTINAYVDVNNLEELFGSSGVPSSFDLLSIDIDSNDWHVWRALNHFLPRVVVIEYNSTYPADADVTIEYDPTFRWDGTSHFGASLKSLVMLGESKGYKLVGCDFIGVNAFFVRADLVSDVFEGPLTAEHHYEPPRYFLYRKTGHPRRIGKCTSAREGLSK